MYLLKVFLISHWLIILKKDCFLKTSDFYSGSDVENQKKVDCPDLFEALFNKSQKVISTRFVTDSAFQNNIVFYCQ